MTNTVLLIDTEVSLKSSHNVTAEPFWQDGATGSFERELQLSAKVINFDISELLELLLLQVITKQGTFSDQTSKLSQPNIYNKVLCHCIAISFNELQYFITERLPACLIGRLIN